MREDETSDKTEAGAPACIGPYRIEGVLGRGGMGVVYRGVHENTGRLAAIKTARRPNATRLACIRREIDALKRVSHPGLVAFLDDGVSDGLPWYAMELLVGNTLRDQLRELWTNPVAQESGRRQVTVPMSNARSGIQRTEPMQTPGRPATRAETHRSKSIAPSFHTTLQAILRLCPALGFLHGNGVVHRDLKPANIFIRDGAQPVLVDLGIATSFGGAHNREALLAEGHVLGTCAYMAPEQIRGELVDARADLYALGCILYECLLGRPPFTGSPAEIARAHLTDSPAPPSAIRSDVPIRLERLILRLLHKHPRDRLGHAVDVANALRELGIESGEPTADPVAAPPYLYRPELVGRWSVISELEQALHDALDKGRGKLVFLAGESGSGKTRMAMELARTATMRSVEVVTCQCAALGAESVGASKRSAPLQPLQPVLQTIADHCRRNGSQATESIVGARGRLLAGFFPELDSLPYERPHPEPIPLPTRNARARLFAALETTLLAYARTRPLLLVLDDLQWADELTFDFLAQLASVSLTGHALLVVATYRVEEVAGPRLDRLTGQSASRVELGRLDRASIRAMVSDMLALDKPPAGVLDFLVEASGGNPFFIAEYLHTAIGAGLLFRDRAGQWHFTSADQALSLERTLPVPQSLQRLITARLGQLDEASREVLRVASVMGRRFDPEFLSGILDGAADGPDEPSLPRALAILRRRQIIEESDDGLVRFVHDKLREYTYASIEQDRARTLHGQVARAMEHRADAGAERAQILAYHWSLAGVAERANRYFQTAGDRAQSAYANHEAVLFYRSAVAELYKMSAPDDDGDWRATWAEVYEKLGGALAYTGQQEDARAAYELGLDNTASQQRIRRGRLLAKLAKAWETHHQYEQALGAYERAEQALGTAPPESHKEWWQGWMELQNGRFNCYYYLARVDSMSAVIERIRPVVEGRGTALQRARFYNQQFNLELRRERHVRLSATGLSQAHAAIAAARESGNDLAIAFALFMLGFALLFRHSLDEAETEMNLALDKAEQISDITLQSRCLTYLVMIHRLQGRPDAAERVCRRALAIAEAGQMEDYIAAARANLGWVAWRRGDRLRAAEYASRACAAWTSLAARYPYSAQWQGQLLLLALAVDELSPEHSKSLERAIEHARALTDESQMQLPDAITAPLQASMRAWDAGLSRDTHDSLLAAVTAARTSNYL